MIIYDVLYAGGAKPNSSSIGGGGGSDTFEAQLLLANVMNSGTLQTEEEIVNETVAVLKNVTGE